MAQKQPPSSKSAPDAKEGKKNLPAPTPVTPVAEKIGEDKDNLKSRGDAFKRRHGSS
jgi:hypothetical protein